MGCQNRCGACLLLQTGKHRITHLPAGFLQPHMLGRGNRRHIRTHHIQRHAARSALCPHKLLIPRRFPAADAMVDMYGNHPQAGCRPMAQQVQQRHGIRAAGKPQQHGGRHLEQGILLRIPENLFRKLHRLIPPAGDPAP